jgi:hypothetical protein
MKNNRHALGMEEGFWPFCISAASAAFARRTSLEIKIRGVDLYEACLNVH